MSGDVTLTCRDCGQGFTFTAGEQDFYASRGFSEPTRCPDCRAARRTERERGSYSTGGGYDSGAPRAPRQMYEAVCTGCGNIASVPFQPSNTCRFVFCFESLQICVQGRLRVNHYCFSAGEIDDEIGA